MRAQIKASTSLLGILALLAACSGDDEPQASDRSPLPLPAAGASRWASIETDRDGDGLAEAIRRFGYDALGRRVSQTTWIAERGVATGAPIELKTWTYDDASRVLTHEVEDSRGRHVVTGAYGADGLLTSTGTNTTYEWKDLRVARVVFSPLRTNVFFYDAGGRVEQVDYQYGNGRVVEEVDRYQWRADGGLSLASHDLPNVGNIVIYRMTHDGAGRVVRSEYSDDGFEMEARRFMYDAHGRLERIDVDNSPTSFDEADFVISWTYRIRWEDGPCQPTYLLTPPPTFDREITLEARSDGTSLGCAD